MLERHGFLRTSFKQSQNLQEYKCDLECSENFGYCGVFKRERELFDNDVVVCK